MISVAALHIEPLL